MKIYKARRFLYRAASVLGDAEAVQKSVKTRSPKPVVKRVVRKTVYRTEGKATRRVLKGLGL
jgi:hypothetical protein